MREKFFLIEQANRCYGCNGCQKRSYHLLPLIVGILLKLYRFKIRVPDNSPGKFALLLLHVVAADIQVLVELVLLLPSGGEY